MIVWITSIPCSSAPSRSTPACHQRTQSLSRRASRSNRLRMPSLGSGSGPGTRTISTPPGTARSSVGSAGVHVIPAATGTGEHDDVVPEVVQVARELRRALGACTADRREVVRQ